MLDHRVLDEQIARHVDTFAVHMELMADLNNAVLILEVFGELIEQERAFVEKHVFGESVVTVDDV